MPTKRKSAGSSSPSGARGKKAGRSRVARDLISGLREAAAFIARRNQPAGSAVRVPPHVDVAAVRAVTGLSQAEFAKRYGFALRTLQEWEQGRAQPDSAVRAYLTVIARDPQAVQAALWGDAA